MASRKFGRKPGFGNYRADVLLDIVEIVKPKGLSAWNEVAEQYMKLTGESGLRSAEDMKRHFNQSLCNSGKKPNDNETSAKAAVIERAQAIYATIRKDRHSSSHKNFEQISSHPSGRGAASSNNGFGAEDPSIPVDLEQEHEHDTENESISSGDDSGRHSGRNTFDERHSGNIESLASAAAAVELAGLEMGMGMGMTTAGMKRSLESVSPINLSGINNNSSNNSSNKHSRVSTTSGRVDTRGRGSSVDSDDLSASSFSAYPRGAYQQQQQQQQQALEGNQFTHRSSTARTSSNASGPTMNSLAGAAAVHHHQQQSQRIAALETRLTSVEQLLKREAEGRQQDRLEFERLLREHQRVEDIRHKEERLEYERLRLEERRQEDERMRLERAEAERVRNEERRLDEARRREERNEAERVRKEDQQRMQLLVLTLLRANGSGSGNGNGNGNGSNNNSVFSNNNHILNLFTDAGITSTSGTGSGGMSTSAAALTSTSNTSSPSE